MEIDISVEVSGLEEWIQKMQLVDVAINSYFTLKQLEELGEIIKNKARELAPFRTGLLKASLQVFIDTVNFTVTIGTDVGYGRFVELGTRKMQAKPFLVPAVFESLVEFKQRYPEKFTEEFEKK